MTRLLATWLPIVVTRLLVLRLIGQITVAATGLAMLLIAIVDVEGTRWEVLVVAGSVSAPTRSRPMAVGIIRRVAT